MKPRRRFLLVASILFAFCISLAAQTAAPRIVYRSRAYQRVGASNEQWWQVDRSGGEKAQLSDNDAAQKQSTCSMKQPLGSRFQRNFIALSPGGKESAGASFDSSELKITNASDGKEIAGIPFPAHGEHWNYPDSISWSPDGKSILVGAEAGSSEAHFDDYWLLDVAQKKWRYAGGGNDAKWSPDSLEIVWTTARDLAPLGKIHVWVSHLVLLNVASLKQQTLTSGITNESEFFWCVPAR